MKICCEAMASLLENRGRYGFSAEVRTTEVVGSHLSIRFCSYSNSEEERISGLLRQVPHEMSLKLAGELVIRRCPWCGYSVKKMLAGIGKGLYWRILDKLRSYSG